MLKKFLALLVVACVSAQDWVQPEYCNGIDCPVFETLESNEEYELRRYTPQQYVSTDFVASTQEEFDRENSEAFNRLFGYIDGGNEAGVIIDMTAPVVDKLLPNVVDPTPFTQSFYVPYIWQGSAPQPTGEGVYLQEFPELTVYVRDFTDYAFMDDHINNINELKAVLDTSNNSTVYNEEVSYWCGYDSPFQPFGRHNEGWLEAANVDEDLS